MIDLNQKIVVELNIVSLGTLIAGMYTTFSEVSLFAIPTELFFEIADALIPFLQKWDYTKLSLEDWIKEDLLIYPREMFSEVGYKEMQSNDIFLERRYGNVTLIATACVGVV